MIKLKIILSVSSVVSLDLDYFFINISYIFLGGRYRPSHNPQTGGPS